MHEDPLNQNVTEWYGCGEYGIIETSRVWLCCCQVKVMEYFKFFSMRYGNTNAVTEGV